MFSPCAILMNAACAPSWKRRCASPDLDWIDPEDAPGVGTPVWGGATYREGHLAMEIIADHGRMLSFEMVEVNPVLDERNQTAELAVELALSAFGKKIL